MTGKVSPRKKEIQLLRTAWLKSHAVLSLFFCHAPVETDAFFFAQSMPGTLFPAIRNSLSTAFISLYVLCLTEDGGESGDQYASRILVSTTVLGIILSIVGILITPVAVPLLAPGFKARS